MEATTLRRREQKEFHFSTLTKEIIIQTVYFLVSTLVSVGAVLGELSPFGVSLVSAVPLRYIGATVGGASLGYILHSPREAFRYIAVLIAISALKWLLSDIKKISGSDFFAPAICFVTMLATGITLLFVSTSKMSELSMCLIEATLSAAGGYFLAKTVKLSTTLRGLSSFSQQELACLAVSSSILILSFGSVEVFSLSLGRTLAVVVILLAAKYGGVTLGSISGISLGVLFSLSSTSMSFLMGCYAFGGLVAGLFASVGKLPVGVAFMLSSLVMSFASGSNKLVLSLFIEALLSTGLFMLIPSSFGNTLKACFLPTKRSDDTVHLRMGVIARLEHASKALAGVSRTVTEVADKLKKSYDTKSDFSVFENAAEKTCRACGLRVYCWEKQREVTSDDLRKLRDSLVSEGFVTDKAIEEKFTKKCCKQRELASSINESYRDYLSALSAQRRITQVRSVVAGQFSGLSDMLSDLSEDFQNSEQFDPECAGEIAEELKFMGLVVTNCCCRTDPCNRMTVELSIARVRDTDFDIREVHRIVSKCAGRRFEKAVESAQGNRLRIVMSELSAYDVEIGTSQHIAGGGALCGDCCDYFLNGAGSMVAVISDGMGTGGTAAVDANMAVSILTKLLKAGLSYDSALSVVNSSLMIKSEEESTATLDVAEINLYTGKVSLLKAGAPLTFVRRAGRVHRREFPSLPVGILSEVKFSKDTITLHEGDVILMISDGAIAGDDKWLQEIVRNWHDASAQDLASIVVNEAIKRRNDGHDDDITAIAMKLVLNE